MENIEVTKNTTSTATALERHNSPELRAAIAQFCRRRSIEAASALSLIALTSFSQAWALSVSELQVESTLGQPLRATLDITTNSGEVVNARCLRLSTPADSGMPGVTGVTLAVSTRLNGATVRFSGSRPLREPMSEMTLNINCSGTPALTKSFLVMLDPPELAATNNPITTAINVQTNTTVSRPAPVAPTRRSAARRSIPRSPIAPGSRYVVQPGDILSVIASRVEGRPDYSVWPIAQRIYDTNPQAFDSSEPDSLRVGSTISIPALSGRLAVAGSVNQVREIRARDAASSRSARREAEIIADTARRAALAEAAAAQTSASTRPTAGSTAPSTARAVATRQPAVRRMAYTRGLSGLSMDRLRQRRAGNPFVVNFANNEAPPAPVPAPQPVPEAAAAPVVVKNPEPTTNAIPAPVVVTRSGGGSWLMSGIALLLGGLLGTLGTGLALRRWLATQKEEQEAEIARAKRHQARLDESRQKRTEEAAPAIVVHEELPRVDISHPTMDAIGSIDEVVAAGVSAAAIGTLLEQDAAASSEEAGVDDLLAHDSSQSEPDLSVDAIEPEAELDYDVFEAPDEDDLELLARDYAESVPDLRELTPDIDFGATQALLTPEKLGMVENETEIIPNPLDLELPEGHEDDTELSIEALRKDSVVAAPNVNDTDSVVDAGDDSTEAVIQLDKELMELAKALPRDNDPTAEAQMISLDEGEQDSDPTSAIPTRDSEDFYHLEASSIRKVDALAFEEDLDDDDTQLVSIRK
jgi:hypothetical protein